MIGLRRRSIRLVIFILGFELAELLRQSKDGNAKSLANNSIVASPTCKGVVKLFKEIDMGSFKTNSDDATLKSWVLARHVNKPRSGPDLFDEVGLDVIIVLVFNTREQGDVSSGDFLYWENKTAHSGPKKAVDWALCGLGKPFPGRLIGYLDSRLDLRWPDHIESGESGEDLRPAENGKDQRPAEDGEDLTPAENEESEERNTYLLNLIEVSNKYHRGGISLAMQAQALHALQMQAAKSKKNWEIVLALGICENLEYWRRQLGNPDLTKDEVDQMKIPCSKLPVLEHPAFKKFLLQAHAARNQAR
eukprot:TRINITY_DN7816_c0_g2_i1.p1 TRINITY_DN7816_c0_g2~~TRINITY_DN7816_c0_g2_i1.p1  ORF type:complete len:305 (-),score=53.06 TRINITY_DN7816_c0_g2_i1:174-1088(-)